MNKLRKAALAIGLSTVMITSLASASFANQIIYEKVEDEIISSGVTYKNILRFGQNGWLNMNVVYVDLNNNNTELDVLMSQGGLATKERLSTMVNNNENVVAAINGDFFYMLNPDSPLGAIVKDGEMISSPVTAHDYATFFVNYDGQAFAEHWKSEIYATTSKGITIPIASINKYTDEYQYIMLIDKNWGAYSPGYSTNLQDMVEVVVVDDIVVEIRQKQPSIAIPENGYILLASKGKSPWYQSDTLLNSVNVGDEISVHKNIQPNLENIKLAFGGGTILVKDGQVSPVFTQNVSGVHPRTAIGITKDRSKLMFVTIDGRHTSYKGVDGTQLAKYLIELGSYEAIMMDGGGSTTMVTRGQGEFDSKVINHLSDGGERRIINGVAVISKAPLESLRGIKAEIEENISFVGASREMKIKAFDKNYNPLTVDNSQLKFSLKSGEGSFNGNYFTPSKSGRAVIGVEYLGSTTEIVLDVLADLAYIEVTPDREQLNYGISTGFKVVGVDSEGYRTKIHARDISWNDKTGLGSFKDGIYTAGGKSGIAALEAYFGNTLSTVNIAVGSNASMLNGFETLDTAFVGYPQSVTGGVSLHSLAKEGKSSLMLEYDFTQTDESRAAYISFGNNAQINNKANSISVWSYAFEPSSNWIRGKVRDAGGAEYVIDFKKNIDREGWKHLTASLPANMVYPVKLERLYVVETDAAQKTYGQILFDGLEVSYSPILSSNNSVASKIQQDKLNKPYEVSGEKISVYSGIKFSQYTLLDKIVSNKVSSSINKDHKLSIFTGDVDVKLSGDIKKPMIVAKSGYSSTENGNSLLIQLDNLKDGLRGTNFTQWPWFKNIVSNTQKQNIFIVLAKPIFGNAGFTDKLEAELLMDTLTELSKAGKRVFVMYGGESISVDVKNGVRYISTGAYSSDPSKDPMESFKYIEFNITNNEVTYQIKPIF